MHAAVLAAKAAAEAAARVDATGEQVHRAATGVITDHGFKLGLPGENSPPDFCSMPHGTGHGLGLDVHEPPLLDLGGGELLDGEVLTIEPGLYGQSHGGVRVEDVYVIRPGGCQKLGELHDGLDWR